MAWQLKYNASELESSENVELKQVGIGRAINVLRRFS